MIIFTLIAHVLLGLIGVGASFWSVIAVAGRKLKLRQLRIASVSAFVFYMLSWFTGGFYYIVQYGDVVKPIIKAGEYPWAHLVVTETKEHVFLFLPLLTLVLAIIALKGGNKLTGDHALRKAVSYLAIVIFLIGIFITISGVVISGAVR